jgi:hypothetical protein
MLRVRFGGWFQCRLATDPDPTDDERGVSGWTFALPGERNLDRVIRTQPAGVEPRVLAPPVGVRVVAVELEERPVPRHPLLGAAFELLGDPVFEGRNGLAWEDTLEPIYPFHLRVAQDGVILTREMRDVRTGGLAYRPSEGTEVDVGILDDAGIPEAKDMVAYLQRRHAALKDELQKTSDLLERLKLSTRLKHLERRQFGPVPMIVGLRYNYTLEGPWVDVKDPGGSLGVIVDYAPWFITLWVGCWDADFLCGYMKGVLTLPVRTRGMTAAEKATKAV